VDEKERPVTRANRAQQTRRHATNQVDDFVTAMLTASRVLVGVSAASLAEVEDTVTLTQFRTLVVLHTHSETNLNGLADELDVNASTAMRMIDRLIAVRLVTRHDNPANRREVQLALTTAGTRLVDKVTAKRRERITRIVTKMPSRKRAELIEALTAFADAAGEPPARTSPGVTW
jgi:DNA-binding MarR family transcriptional regulator